MYAEFYRNPSSALQFELCGRTDKLDLTYICYFYAQCAKDAEHLTVMQYLKQKFRNFKYNNELYNSQGQSWRRNVLCSYTGGVLHCYVL
jgi:hypothetical protein